jgi:excinuclease ABC subunit C
VLHLIQRVRDESHRFAITYHRKRREMRDRDSELLGIPGVGARTRTRLLQHFGSLRSVEQANVEALTAVVPRKTAESIYGHFHAAEAVPNLLPVLSTRVVNGLHVVTVPPESPEVTLEHIREVEEQEELERTRKFSR